MADYEEARNYLDHVTGFAKKTALSNVQWILDVLGNPEKELSFIHVAGTNGKGSVCAFLDSILTGAGKKTGRFTSPHLVRIEERIQFCGREISKIRFAQVFTEVKEAVSQAVKEGAAHPSFFEFLFLMSVVFFKEEEAEICIMETGMGGRHDATNVIMPEVSILTAVSLDHQEFLGDTLELIAGEKAGIIKPKVPVICLEQKPEVMEVFQAEAERQKSEFLTISKDNLIFSEKSCDYIDFFKKSAYDKKSKCLKLGLFGDFQYENAALAAAAVHLLFPEISRRDVFCGLASASLTGRMEEVSPGIYIDGGHNLQAAEAFCHTLDSYFPQRKLIVFAPSHRQEEEGILKLLKKVKNVEGILKVPVENRKIPDDDFIKAYKTMIQKSEEGILCFCIGSFYLAGKVKNYMEEENDQLQRRIKEV
ncbi:MAG: bifunctional folylpolyglutamate synthase/dihydrofolate synthase [Anaerostipes sp.]|nr:bifunctional folylpolyglutamate synthase/dihydrofolate synthase [Anaerostipes sp.]